MDYKIKFNDNINNKNNIFKKNDKINKEETKTNINNISEKQTRRNMTSHEANRNNPKLPKNIPLEGTPYLDKNIIIPKKKESNTLLRKNIILEGNNTTNLNVMSSKRELSQKINTNKISPITGDIKNSNTFNKKILLNEKKNLIEIINYIDINKQYIEENLKIDNEIKIYDTFCIGVFISGLSPPIKTTSIIENSEYFMAPCGHLQCSIFPSIQPELLNTYINQNSKSFNNLSQLVSNMCFPLGIKPCFGCRFDENNKIDNLPSPQQTFYNIIKNEKNEIYYIATLQYFIKMSNSDYLMKYKFNPITYFLNKNEGKSNVKDKKFQNNMKMISNSLNNNNIFIPESISLISKYPLFIPMDKCLRCMISLQSEDMNNLINHLVNEVPSPKKNYQIQFFIPKIREPIILNHEYNKFLKNKRDNNSNNYINNNLLSTSQINVKFLLDKISVENIIMIFQLMLLEQKILFLENNYQILSEISFTFLELIYPLIWTNPFLPVLSIKTVQFLQSPVPFIMGLDEYLLKNAFESSTIYLGTDIIIFNLMTNQFISSKTKKRIHKKDIFHEFKLPTIPDKIGDYVYKELKYVKKLIEKNEKYKEQKEKPENEIIRDEEIDKQIRMIFLKAMIMLIGDYNNFLFYTEDEIPLFNKEAFVQSHKDKNSQFFLGEMVKTQVFNQFLLNEKQLYIKTQNKLKDISKINSNNENNLDKNDKLENNKINYELIDTSYFKKYISVYHDLLNSEKIRNRASSSKKIGLPRSIKKKLSSQRKSQFSNAYNNKIEKAKNINNIYIQKENNPVSSKIKDNNILYDLENNKKAYGNYSIDYIRGKNNAKINSNVNLSEGFPSKINDEENNLEDINRNNKKYINEISKEKNILFEDVKKVLLYPYFLPKYSKQKNDITLKGIEELIGIYVQKKNFKFQCQDKEHVFIISKRQGYKFNNISQKRLYLIPINKSDNLELNIKDKNYMNDQSKNEKYIDEKYTKDESIDNIDLKTINLNQNNINNNNTNNNEIHNPVNSINKNTEETKLIKDCFILCYTNKNRLTKEQLNTLDKIFLNEENKLFFANLILPDTKIKKTKNHKLLTSTSFEDLGKILSLSLGHLTSSEYNTCRLLTISSFVYYKIENKKLIYLYDNFIHGIYPCRLWLSEKFWENFFKFEYDEEKQNENDLINLYKCNLAGSINYMLDIDKNIIEKNKDQIILDITKFMIEIMAKLKLSQNLILNTFENYILNKYEQNDDKIAYLMNQIMNMLDKF